MEIPVGMQSSFTPFNRIGRIPILFATSSSIPLNSGPIQFPCCTTATRSIARPPPIPLKGVKEDCIPTGISIYWCINSQSGDKEKEASKEFLKWLFQSDEGKQIVVNDFGFVPAFNNYDDVEITDPLSKEVKRYIDEGKTLPWVMGGFPSGYEPKAAADFQGYFSGEYTFDQMVDQLKADFVELKK